MNTTGHGTPPSRFEHDPRAPFWMVYVQGTQNTSVRHYDENEAKAEAERLARQTCRKVYLLMSTAMMEVAPAPITTTPLVSF